MSSHNPPGIRPRLFEQDPSGEHGERAAARRRLESRRKLSGDVIAYLAVNAFLVAIWALSGRGYFWPGWVAGGWGVLLLLDAWSVFFRRPITEADIDREMRKR